MLCRAGRTGIVSSNDMRRGSAESEPGTDWPPNANDDDGQLKVYSTSMPPPGLRWLNRRRAQRHPQPRFDEVDTQNAPAAEHRMLLGLPDHPWPTAETPSESAGQMSRLTGRSRPTACRA